MSENYSGLLLRVDEAAKLLNISSTTVWKLAQEGRLHPVKFGRRTTRFPRHQILALAGAPAESVAAEASRLDRFNTEVERQERELNAIETARRLKRGQ